MEMENLVPTPLRLITDEVYTQTACKKKKYSFVCYRIIYYSRSVPSFSILHIINLVGNIILYLYRRKKIAFADRRAGAVDVCHRRYTYVVTVPDRRAVGETDIPVGLARDRPSSPLPRHRSRDPSPCHRASLSPTTTPPPPLRP